MKNNLLKDRGKVWPKITASIKAAKNPCYAAVAYMGQGRARLLPLPKGSKLVVDASLGAVRSGQTDPRELLILHDKEVEIYSHPGLHAKVVVADRTIFIGSANVSQRSANQLTEAVFSSRDPALVKDAITFIDDLPVRQLGPRELRQLQSEYRPPKNVPQASDPRTTQKRSSVYIYYLGWGDYDEAGQVIAAKGAMRAERKRTKRSRHFLDDFEWNGKVVPGKDDHVIHVMQEGSRKYVYPPGTVIHREFDAVNNRYFIWSEMLNTGGVPISKLPRSYQHAIGRRSGKRINIDVAGLERELKRLAV